MHYARCTVSNTALSCYIDCQVGTGDNVCLSEAVSKHIWAQLTECYFSLGGLVDIICNCHSVASNVETLPCERLFPVHLQSRHVHH